MFKYEGFMLLISIAKADRLNFSENPNQTGETSRKTHTEHFAILYRFLITQSIDVAFLLYRPQ